MIRPQPPLLREAHHPTSPPDFTCIMPRLVVVRVVERDGDLALMIDDGGGAPRVAYLGSMFTRQELTLVERWRTMPGERRVAFPAFSELLAAMREFAGAREDEPLGFIARKAFRDAARALDGEA